MPHTCFIERTLSAHVFFFRGSLEHSFELKAPAKKLFGCSFVAQAKTAQTSMNPQWVEYGSTKIIESTSL
jgi:hypothetical protein